MDRVLFAKYNSTRRPEYRIVTEIREDERGKYIVKRAASSSAQPHIIHMTGNGDLLRSAYRSVKVILVEKLSDTALRFPFVEGTSFLHELEQTKPDKEGIIAYVNGCFDLMFDVNPDCISRFSPSPRFTELFGDSYPLEGEAVCPANIDSALGNFIRNDQGVFCLDYEWVCEFPVPVDYIKYRTLIYLHQSIGQSMLEGIPAEEFLGWFGLDQDACVVFSSMEDAFQQHVHGDRWRYLYLPRYKKPEIPLQALRNRAVDQEKTILEKENHIRNITANLAVTEKAVRDKDKAIAELQTLTAEQGNKINQLNSSIHDKDVHIRNQDSMIRAKDAQCAQLERQYNEISNAFFWRITKPARVTLIKLRELVKKNEHVYRFFRFVKLSLRVGPGKAKERLRSEKAQEERARELNRTPTEAEIERQKKVVFDRKIKFSILVPLYNTSEKYLTAMIDSVVNQTYGNWELCLADGSDGEHAYVGDICRKESKKDHRILYRKLEKNLGISENTNACIGMATGDYIGLFDHDDLLHPFALFDNMQVICRENADFIYSDENTFHETPEDAYWPHYKPDFAPDTLRSYNYICHFTVFSRGLLEKAGGCFRKEFDGSQDYDLILRLTEKAEHIVHIPKVLYYWRSHKDSTAADIAAKPYTMEAAKKAIAEHLERVGLKGTVLDSVIPSTYKVRYDIQGEPLISIIIPNKDHIEDLDKCLRSIREKSTWKNWEAIVVENNSTEEATFAYYKEAEKDGRIRVVKWEREFNFSAINNFGAQYARGEYLLLLNNDIEIITPDWLEQMLMFAQRKDVGAVGAMLYYPDDTVQHAGVILGIGGVAGHSHKYFKRGEYGYASRMTIAQNLSAVTAACVMMPRKVWDEVQGLDEGFAVAFNDIDLCMKIRKAGYLIVWTPYAELYHYESKSRGLEDNPEKQKRFKGEIDRFMDKWGKELEAGDPYYNPNLTLITEDFAFRE